MANNNDNQVLKRITRQIYDQRPIMPSDRRTHYRIERSNGGFLCDLWFLTRGCIHDASGGCTMCNYGKGSTEVSQDKILDELQKIVKKLPWAFEDFLLTPSGSMLDTREVPYEMRDSLKKILKDIKAKRFIIETRADTVTEGNIDFLKNILPEAEKYIEIGYESGNNWILRNCINKGTDTETFEKAVKIAHEAGVKVTANVAAGIPFLSERAAIREAVFSVNKAFEQGADSVVLFPYHVKRGTLLEVLYRHQWYQCISLWSLVDILMRVPESRLDQIQISWYKDYFGEEQSNIFVSATTCQNCRQDIVDLLDKYREHPSVESLRRLSEYECECKRSWQENLEEQSEGIEYDKIEIIYRRLAAEYHIEDEVLEKELQFMKRTIRG